MKYLKAFSTENERQNYQVKNDMISYVEETDLVYTSELYKVASVTMTMTTTNGYIPVYGGGVSRQSTSTRSSIDKITINGETVDINKLSLEYIFNSDNINTCLRGEQEKTADGHDLYSSTIFNGNRRCWFDFENGIVRLEEDNSQAIYVSDGTRWDIPAGEYPLYWEYANTYGIQVYLMNGSSKFTFSVGMGYEHTVNPIVLAENQFQPNEYVIELYSKDKNVKFDFAQNTPQTNAYYSHSNYTITKNVKYIGKLIGNSTIQELTYEGTIAEFEAIEKVAKWNVYYTSPRYGDYKSVTVVHCTDGDLSV